METFKILVITGLVLVSCVFVLQAGVVSASTLNVSGTCVDDDYRISKNGAVVYDGGRINECGSVATSIEANCNDKIKLEIKDNLRVRVGFNSITLSRGSFSKPVTGFYYLGVFVPAGQKKVSNFPGIRYYDTDIDGTKTLSELGLCESCTPHTTQRCVGNSAYWFDSCNNQQELIQACPSNQVCSNGSCVNNCTPHTTQRCVGNNVYWYDSCNNQEELKQTCSANQACSNGSCTAVACSSNTDCGTNAYEGSPFCQGNNIYKNFRTYTCNNPGASNSSCSSSTTPQLLNACSGNQTCSGGSCSDVSIACTLNSQCGTNAYVNSPFCQGGSVYQDFKTYTCSNPGSANSSCSSSTAPQQKQTCSGNQACSSGSCVSQNFTCNSSADCGTSAYVNSPFCQGGNVYQDFKTYTCSNPGSANSSCSSSTAPQLKTDCSSNQACSGGSCSVQNNLVASCYATPNPANSNQSVSFITSATGGNGNYTYSWSGACSGTGQICANSFLSPGTQVATVSVTSGSQTTSAVCSAVINQNCILQTTQRCVGNNVYWYDSCGVQGGLLQYCQNGCTNGFCSNQNTNCTYHSNQRCVNNSVYWYDSCGVQQDLMQICNSNQTCSNGYCQTINNYNNSNFTVNVTAKNLTTGLGWYSSVAAGPSDMLMFMITLTAQGNQGANNVFVRDILPYGLTYRNNLVVSGANSYSGDIASGINIGTISPGQTVTITYQAQVDPASSFSYGTSSLTDNVSITGSGSNPSVSNAIVTVTRAAVYGATTVSTGLTNNLLADSFFLPLMLALLGLWLFRSGLFGFEKWADKRKFAAINYKAQKELNTKIAKIREKEKL